jgi:hypothetical protein
MNTDGTKVVIESALVPIEPAGEVELVTGPKDLSDSDIEAYAKRTGVTTIKLKALAQRSVMGELVTRLGAAKVGSSMLVDSEEMIKEGIKLCDDMLGEYAHDSKLVGSIMKVRLGFVDLWVKAAQTHIKSRKDAGAEDSDKKPQNTPFPPPPAVTVNIQQNAVSNDKPTL